MKAILEVPEKDIKFELDNFRYNQFRMIAEKPSDLMFIERYAIGNPITLITSNMPPPLQDEIERLISSYCNH